CKLSEERLTLTADGVAYLRDPSAIVLFERLNSVWAGILEVLVIASAVGHADTDRTYELLRRLLGVTWESTNQVSFRRNWLLSLGMTERSAEGDQLTSQGIGVIERHRDETASIRARLDEMLDEVRPDVDDDDETPVEETGARVAPGLDVVKPKSRGEPSAWSA